MTGPSDDRLARDLLDRIDNHQALAPQLLIALAQVHTVLALLDAIEGICADLSAWAVGRTRDPLP